MSNDAPTVSIIIPTKNSVRFLQNLFESIENQSFGSVETIVVDGHSSDGTVEMAQRFGVTVLDYDPGVAVGKFDAPHRRNFGAKMSVGQYVYYVDADMELHPDTVKEAVGLCTAGAAAVIVAEQSFGTGPWARAKALERLSYIGDDTVEAPRFFVRAIWDELGGLDETLGGGGDDWDLHQALKGAGYTVGRTEHAVRHNEGDLRLLPLLRKRYMYGQDSWRYIKKRPRAALRSYFPLHAAYFRNWRKFLADPVTAALVIVMRFSEYGAGFAGTCVGIIRERRQAGLSE
jgi:glycosyltransferase involved in cell wall biosynthesis